MRIQIRNAGKREILFGGCRREDYHRPQVLARHGWETAQNLAVAATLCQARENRPQKNARAADNRLAAANLRVSNNVVVIVHGSPRVGSYSNIRMIRWVLPQQIAVNRRLGNLCES